jgi:hypothetical protein
LWLGCMGGYDPKGREIIADFARVMNYLGTSFGVLRKEKCTATRCVGWATIWSFSNWPNPTRKSSPQNKVKKIVSICPHCVRTIQEDWKEFGAPPPVEHHSEFLARFAEKLPKQSERRTRSSITIPATWGAIATSMKKPRTVVALAGELVEATAQRMSAVSAAERAAGWFFSARKPANESARCAPLS